MDKHQVLIQAIQDKPISGLRRLYTFILDYYNGSTIEADKFCLSNRGGFTRGELNKVKYQIDYQRQRYINQKINA